MSEYTVYVSWKRIRYGNPERPGILKLLARLRPFLLDPEQLNRVRVQSATPRPRCRRTPLPTGPSRRSPNSCRSGSPLGEPCPLTHRRQESLRSPQVADGTTPASPPIS